MRLTADEIRELGMQTDEEDFQGPIGGDQDVAWLIAFTRRIERAVVEKWAARYEKECNEREAAYGGKSHGPLYVLQREIVKEMRASLEEKEDA